MDIQEYYDNFKQGLIEDSGEELLGITFIQKVCAIISEQGGMEDATLVNYKYTQKGIALDAWAEDPGRDRLVLFVADFRNSETIETLNHSDIEKSLKRLDRFVTACQNSSFVDALEDSDDVVPIARLINENYESLDFEFVLISDATISSRVHEITPHEYGVAHAKQCAIWDLQRLYELDTSGKEREPLEVDFTDFASGGIPCLKCSDGSSAIQSFLFVLPGVILAQLYQKYGDRLLEQNVRTFLQFRGDVNKGIKNTIINEPDRFFSYNNGLSATGEEVLTTSDGGRLLKIKNLQIVNGGQTTASIYNASHKEHADLSQIFVQVKLSIVDPTLVNDVVPLISKWANTQNIIRASDFASNSPFHLRVEECSRRIWAPAADGGLKQTHWFYERTRGQYANMQTNMSQSELRKFLASNPKNQMFSKTDLAKYYLTFHQKPFIAARGAQKAFTGTKQSEGFVSIIKREWEGKGNVDSDGNNISINDAWFRNLISQIILSKSLDRRIAPILKVRQYGSYKAAIVTYTLSAFMEAISKRDVFLDLKRIWQKQSAPEEILENLLQVAEQITDFFKNASTNSSEYAKKEICWQEIQKIPVKLLPQIEPFLCSREEQKEDQKEAARKQKDINQIQGVIYIVNKGDSYWQKLMAWNDLHHMLSAKELGILNIASSVSTKGRTPSDAQAKILIAAEARAIDNGFFVKS